MSIYNYLEFTTVCPRCHTRQPVEANFRFGSRNLDHYRPGEKLCWEGSAPIPRRRPPDGNYTGDGYVECPHCHRDFWVTIRVEHDVIASVEVDAARPGYVPDPPAAQEAS